MLLDKKTIISQLESCVTLDREIKLMQLLLLTEIKEELKKLNKAEVKTSDKTGNSRQSRKKTTG